MRGQAALEYLLLSALALSLILFSASALSGMKDSAQKNAEMLSFRSDALSLADAMGEICALGDGNGRELSLSAELSIESENTDEGVLVRFSSKNATLVRRFYCNVEDATLSGTVYVENEKGVLVFRGR